MTMQATMTGPDGAPVTAYKRSARQVCSGDYLPDWQAHAVTEAVTDPDDGSVWITLETGEDIRVTVRKVWVHRTYSAPEWMSEALDAYRCARDARDAIRESSDAMPAGIVAGAAGSGAAWNQLEPEDFTAAYPAPRLADYIREAAASRRDAS